MSQTAFNPYAFLGVDLGGALDTVPAAMPANFDALVALVYSQTVSFFYGGAAPNTLTQNAIKSVAYHAANGFINSTLDNCNYSGEQRKYIDTLLRGVSNVPVRSLASFILDVEDNIPKSSLTYQQQIPLFFATSVGWYTANYWIGKINTPGAMPNWTTWFDTDGAGYNENYNRMNISYWTAAAMEGSLLTGNLAINYGLIDPPIVASADVLSSFIGAFAVAAGTVLFNFTPRIFKS